MVTFEKIGEPYSVMNNPGSIHNYFAWPSLVRLQNGRIAVSSSGYRMIHIDPFGKAVIAFSEDEGATFTRPIPVIDTVLDDRDAGLCPFGKSGLILTSFNNTTNFQRTFKRSEHHPLQPGQREYIDRYLNLVSPEAENAVLGSTFRVSFDCGVTWGELHRSPVTSPHGPIECRSGEILWVGRAFFTESDRATVRDTVQAWTLDPATGEMKQKGEIEPIFSEGEKLMSCEPFSIELPSGKLLCHIRVESKAKHCFTTFQSVSTDRGVTWSKPEQILPDLGGAPAHILLHSSGLLVGTVGYRENPYGIHTYFSRDEGVTWEEGAPLFDAAPTWDVGYPMTCECRDKSLLTAFYAHPDAGSASEIFIQHWNLK